MPPSASPHRARANRGPRMLAAMAEGARLDEIAEREGLRPQRVEKLLSEELRRRWVAPARDYSRLQIARLEAIIVTLRDKAGQGDMAAIDRLLKVFDRLDRYHGFAKFVPAAQDDGENIRERLRIKLDRVAARMLANPRSET